MRATLLFLSLLPACGAGSLPPEPDRQSLDAGDLLARADAAGIHLENRSARELRVAVVDSLFFEHGLASWCLGQDECGVSLPGGTVLRVPADEVTGPPPRGRAVSVFWWDVRADLTPAQKSGRFQRLHLRLP
jgi:hypothetical protein